MMISNRHSYIEILCLFCLALLLFTVNLSHQEIIGFEARFYLFALEMWRHGPSWFPTTYQQPYPDYPGFSTLLIYGFSKCVGQLNKFTAVFPSAVAASITVVMTFWIGALHDKRWGWFAVFFLLLTNMFVMEARTISPDQYVAMVTTVCFYLAYSAELLQKTKRLWWIPILLLVGFAFRGPIGLVVPAGVLTVYYLLDQQYKKFFALCFVAAFLLVLGCALLLGAAYHVGGMPFVHNVMQMEVIGRLQDAHLPWFYYFVESLGAYALTYPLVVLIGIGWCCSQVMSRSSPSLQAVDEFRLLQKLAGWVLVVIIGLTVPAGKKIRYILAFAPALALISASLFVMPRPQTYFIYLRKVMYAICVLLPSLCLIATIAVSHISAQKHLHLMISNASLALFFVFLQLISATKIKQEGIVLGLGVIAFWTATIFLIEPVNLALNRTQDFVYQVESARHNKMAKLVFYQDNPDGTPIKYVVDMQQEETPIFINTPDELLQFKHPAFFVMSQDRFHAMPKVIADHFQQIYEGAIGHEPVIVLERKTLD